MVVDDEPDIVETLEYSLELRGYQVTTAFDGLDALERAKQNPPDVLLLDVMLPGCNGYEVSRLLKEWMEATPGVAQVPDPPPDGPAGEQPRTGKVHRDLVARGRLHLQAVRAGHRAGQRSRSWPPRVPLLYSVRPDPFHGRGP